VQEVDTRQQFLQPEEAVEFNTVLKMELLELKEMLVKATKSTNAVQDALPMTSGSGNRGTTMNISQHMWTISWQFRAILWALSK
jgi:hypothetical protein